MPADDGVAVTGGGGAGEAVAVELLETAVGKVPALTTVGAREQLLAAAWLASHRSPRTRRAYAGDLLAWLARLARRGVDVLAATRVHVDLHARQLTDDGAAPSSVNRRLSALSSFYRHLAGHDLVPGNPVTGVRRHRVDPDATTTVGLTREQARALLAAADADAGPQRLRTAAAVRLLLLGGFRVEELAAADTTDLGHRVLRITRKGGTRATAPLAPAAAAALDTYLAARAAAASIEPAQLRGPLLATATNGRLDQAALWHLVRRLARTATIPSWTALSPHSLRHTALTLALDSGAALRDVQDMAGHRDPRTTRRYDHSRGSLDRHPTYGLAAYLAT